MKTLFGYALLIAGSLAITACDTSDPLLVAGNGTTIDVNENMVSGVAYSVDHCGEEYPADQRPPHALGETCN